MLEKKIKNRKELRKTIWGLKKKGKRIVFTNGCFDILHYGHVKYLEDAKRKGDILVVAVNSDSSVRKLKGPNRPIVPEKDRIKTIAGLASVDFVTMFGEDTPLETIIALEPDILVKGADWKKNIVGSDFVCGYGGRAEAIKLVPGRSTSGLIRKIAKTS